MTGTTNPLSSKTPLVLILMAAGSSTRMGGRKKEFLPLSSFCSQEKPYSVLSYAALPFLRSQSFSHLVVTYAEGMEEKTKRALLENPEVENLIKKNGTILSLCCGGSTRQESVYKALCMTAELFPAKDAVVLIHDGARPFLTDALVCRTTECALSYGAAVPYINAVDTFKRKDKDSVTIKEHLDRSLLAAVQTPQAFKLLPLLKCHKMALQKSFASTDDTEIWDTFPELTGGIKVHLVEGEVQNKKITYESDMNAQNTNIPEFRTGLGTDTHRLVAGRKLIIGTVEIPFEKGEEAHSDGDVLLHAITDALLGASAMGDIGSYFPPEDSQWKNANSAKLLQTVWSDIKKEGWHIQNIDCVLELEKPKFLPYREKVREGIAKVLDIKKDRVFVKAKTGEGLDSTGHGEAIKAFCTCLLYRRS